MSVDFWELDGYPKEERDILGNFSAVRRVMCDWSDRYTLRTAFLGSNGQVYPYIPDHLARVQAVSSEPFGQQDQDPVTASMATYTYALMTVKYSTPTVADAQPNPSNPTVPDQMISENIEPYVEALRLPHDKFKWSNGDMLKPDEAPVRPVSRVRYSLTRHNLTAVPAWARDLVGKINSDVVRPILLTGVWSFPAHTLLFQPPRIELSADSLGGSTFSVACSFLYKEEGWRKYWHARTQAYETILSIEDGSAYNYPEAASFAPIFP